MYSGYNIGSDGAKIAEVLTRSPVLKELILSNNCFKQEGDNFITQAIPNCTSLTALVLSSNIIGQKGLRN